LPNKSKVFACSNSGEAANQKVVWQYVLGNLIKCQMFVVNATAIGCEKRGKHNKKNN
jgi:hypothetical protein